MTTAAQVQALERVRKFIEYARYELEPKLMPFAQFPSQECADKELARLDEVIATLQSPGTPAEPSEWQPINTLSDCVTALTIHQCDLYPVAAFRVRDANGREIWMSEVEGPEDDATRPGNYRVLSRAPTHWKEIDWPLNHDSETCPICNANLGTTPDGSEQGGHSAGRGPVEHDTDGRQESQPNALAAEPSGPVETPPDRFKLAQLLNRLGDIEEYLRAGASNVALREVTRLMADMEATAARDTAPPQAEPLVCHNPAQDMRDAGLLLAPEHTSAAEPPETPPFAAPAPPGFRWLKECRVNAAGNYDTGWYLHRITQAEPSADGPPADLVALVREWQAAKATIRRIFDAWDSGDDGPSDAGVLGPVVQRRKDAEAALISYPLPAEQAPR